MITLGTLEQGGALKFDLERLLLTKLLVQANSGGGKSWILRRLLEQTYGKVPHLVFDVDDEFHTLREKFAYVYAGASGTAGADVRVEAKTAPLLVRRILEHGFSTIVSIHEMKSHHRAAFVRTVLEHLMESPRRLWRPLLVVVDEAHLYCPEKGSGEAESSAAVIDLMTRGRKRGFCGVLATQRISKLHKDAAAEANNKLIGRAALDVDMKRAGDELGFGAEQRKVLRDLEPGEFYCFGPALTRTVEKVTVGGVETTHPEPGSRGSAAPAPPPARLAPVLELLRDLPKALAEEEGELERLRKTNADLRETNAELEKGGSSQVELLAAYERGRKEAMTIGLKRLDAFVERLKTLSGAITEHVDGAVGELATWREKIEGEATEATVVFTAPPTPPRYEPRRAPAATAPRDAAAPIPNLSGSQQRVLDALAWLESVGIDRASKIQLALLAGASPNSSGYANNLGGMRTAGLLEYPSSGKVALTDGGRGAANRPARPPTTQDLHDTLKTKLSVPQWKILEQLIRVYPNDLKRGALADLAGQSATSSGYANNLGALRSLGFVDYPRAQHVIAQSILFLEEA